MQICANGSVAYSRYSRALTALARLMGSDASAGGATATNSSSLSSSANITVPVLVPSSSLTRFGDPRLARRALMGSFDVTWGGLGATWAAAGSTGNLGGPAGRTEGGSLVTGVAIAGARVGAVANGAIESTIETAMGAHEALQCDSVRRKRKKKMNKHKHSKRLRANKHKR